MRRFALLLLCSVAGVSPGSSQAPQVEVFGAGVISSPLPEFATSFSPSGDTVYFNRTSEDRSEIYLLFSVRTADGWSEPRPLDVAGGARVVDPFVTSDGSRLYFSSNRQRPGTTSASFGLWYADRAEEGWGAPVPLPEPVNSDSSDVFNSLADDGTMVFSSRRDGTRRVYRTRPAGAGWAAPELVRFGSVDAASNPAVSPDGNLLVVSITSSEAPPDLFVACRTSSGWSEPIRLPEGINSAFTEFAPAFFGEHLYFTSERPGVASVEEGRPPGDIYRTAVRPIARLCGPNRP